MKKHNADKIAVDLVLESPDRNCSNSACKRAKCRRGMPTFFTGEFMGKCMGNSQTTVAVLDATTHKLSARDIIPHEVG